MPQTDLLLQPQHSPEPGETRYGTLPVVDAPLPAATQRSIVNAGQHWRRPRGGSTSNQPHALRSRAAAAARAPSSAECAKFNRV